VQNICAVEASCYTAADVTPFSLQLHSTLFKTAGMLQYFCHHHTTQHHTTQHLNIHHHTVYHLTCPSLLLDCKRQYQILFSFPPKALRIQRFLGWKLTMKFKLDCPKPPAIDARNRSLCFTYNVHLHVCIHTALQYV
jgi:hypothetical protein